MSVEKIERLIPAERVLPVLLLPINYRIRFYEH
jgi:hypothetical protein